MAAPPAHGGRADTAPLLVHVHVPKTAGQSFMNRLWCSFADRVLHIDYATDPAGTGPTVAPDLDYIVRELRRNPDALAITSHCFRFAHPTEIAGRRAVYVTFLREPSTQAKSWIRYVHKNFDDFPLPTREFLGLPPETSALSPTELAARMIEQFEDPPARDASGFWFLPCAFFGAWGDAGAIVERLERFAFVGTVERLAESLRLLASRLRNLGIELDDDALPHLNRSSDVAEPADELDGFAPLRSFLDAHAAADLEVWDWATRRLRDAIDRGVPS